MSRCVPISWVVAAIAWAGCSDVSGQDGGGAPRAPLQEWIAPRLESLDPAEARQYFLLGEEIAAEALTREEEDLASHLFGLAFELDMRDGTPTWISPSSCLGLASLARLESDKRWLRALANRLDPDYAAPAWRNPELRAGVSEAAFDAAEAIGSARAGDGLRARDLLDKPGVKELIERYGQLLGFSSSSGALWQIEQWAAGWPCRECGNERVVFRPNTDPPSYRECYSCRGNPGPELSGAQLISQLRFESHLLHGISRSWGAQLALDYGAPLREPAPEELASVLGIDAGRPYWRGGQWVASPDGATAPDPTVEEAAPVPDPTLDEAAPGQGPEPGEE
jgi:hypothetical protein